MPPLFFILSRSHYGDKEITAYNLSRSAITDKRDSADAKIKLGFLHTARQRPLSLPGFKAIMRDGAETRSYAAAPILIGLCPVDCKKC
jgi:hypothetical protein